MRARRGLQRRKMRGGAGVGRHAAGCGSVRMALSGATLYLTAKMSGAVQALQSPAVPLLTSASGQTGPSQIAADASGVYWVVAGDGSLGSSKLMKKSLLPGQARRSYSRLPAVRTRSLR